MCLFNEMWIMVKYLGSSNSTWFSTKDNMKGYDYLYTSNEKVFPYSESNYNKFLFYSDERNIIYTSIYPIV